MSARLACSRSCSRARARGAVAIATGGGGAELRHDVGELAAGEGGTRGRVELTQMAAQGLHERTEREPPLLDVEAAADQRDGAPGSRARGVR